MNDQDDFPAYNEPLPPLRPKSGSLEQPDPVTGETTDFDSVLPSGPPPVVGWYKVYAGFMALLYLLTAIGGFYVIKNLATIQAVLTGFTPEELKVRALVTLAIGIVLFTSYVTALLLPKTPGVWVFHTILIGVGLSSCCLWPVTIPMMIAWLKPETQRWFGRNPAGNQPYDPDVPPPPIPTA